MSGTKNVIIIGLASEAALPDMLSLYDPVYHETPFSGEQYDCGELIKQIKVIQWQQINYSYAFTAIDLSSGLKNRISGTLTDDRCWGTYTFAIKTLPTSYTDQTVLTFGKYKFASLCRVSPGYLLDIFKNKSYPNNDLKGYIENNIDLILSRERGTALISVLELPCSKIQFATEALAKEELRRIQSLNQEGVKPVRAYECPQCSAWHLTKKPL